MSQILFEKVYSKKGFGPGEQEWGYVDVRPGAHMFCWLYYTTNTAVSNYYDKPLLIWIQGGPGSSSTGFGNFGELGPLDEHLNTRNYTWVKDYNVLFIDNPVGTGFSYVDDFSILTTNNSQIARDLMELIRAFYQKIPEFKTIPTYIVSESYGGKMTAEWALEWYKGIVDTTGREAIEASAKQIGDAIKAGLWQEAFNSWDNITSVITSATGGFDWFNVLTKVEFKNDSRTQFADFNVKSSDKRSRRSTDDDPVLEKLMNGQVRESLNITAEWGAQSNETYDTLGSDFMKPVIDVVEHLLDETDLKIFIYSGQLDMIVDTPGTLRWVERMRWKHAKQWHSSERVPLVVNDIIEGYVKRYDNLGFYWVDRAGHMVPADNPAAMAKILEHLVQY
ncbi:hypothetical protein QAD02_009321 [Eretmocerus hayati]|uniref:Uncharacterized protein n=1 Tax=Eretmocerus hayati TaxID=131215 RepID=A0ACC2N960_9HYME|nr:hypothetical protein QAD02_009321 [Eretmocerus hayati]